MPPRDPRSDAQDAEEDLDRKAFLLRIPPSLMSELKGWAAQELRSLNGHIEWILREAVRRRKREGP